MVPCRNLKLQRVDFDDIITLAFFSVYTYVPEMVSFYKINIAISFVKKANQRMLNIDQAKDHEVLHQPYWEPCASLIVAFST